MFFTVTDNSEVTVSVLCEVMNNFGWWEPLTRNLLLNFLRIAKVCSQPKHQHILVAIIVANSVVNSTIKIGQLDKYTHHYSPWHGRLQLRVRLKDIAITNLSLKALS